MKGAVEDFLTKMKEGGEPRAPSGQFVWTPIEGSNAMGRTWVKNTKMDQAPRGRPQPQRTPSMATSRSDPMGGRDPRDYPPTHEYVRPEGIPDAPPMGIVQPTPFGAGPGTGPLTQPFPVHAPMTTRDGQLLQTPPTHIGYGVAGETPPSTPGLPQLGNEMSWWERLLNG